MSFQPAARIVLPLVVSVCPAQVNVAVIASYSWDGATAHRGVSKDRVKGSQRVKKEHQLPADASDRGLSGIQNGCMPEQKQQVPLGYFSIFWESTCFAVPVLGYNGVN